MISRRNREGLGKRSLHSLVEKAEAPLDRTGNVLRILCLTINDDAEICRRQAVLADHIENTGPARQKHEQSNHGHDERDADRQTRPGRYPLQ